MEKYKYVQMIANVCPNLRAIQVCLVHPNTETQELPNLGMASATCSITRAEVQNDH